MSCNSKDELAEIQKLFSAAVFRQPGCKTLDSAFEDIAMNLIKPCATQSSSERLGVYREQYWYRAYDSLADAFPSLVKVLGAEVFENFVSAYLDRFKSSSYTLRDLGQQLPQFCLDYPAFSTEQKELIFQIASFEWAEIVAFDSAVVDDFDASTLSTVDGTRLHLSLKPNLTLLSLSWAIDEFVQKTLCVEKCAETARLNRNVEHSPICYPRRETNFVVVYRHEQSVFYKRIDSLSYRMLLLIRAGKSLAEIVETIGSEVVELNEEELASAFTENFATWMSLGWLASGTSMACYGEQ
ncbi:MAG: putative DNA-binding domain-containing protein [Candidatus Obscuribacter sp.]|nr:putative DNA-binding domain-containing protein [Candidatus Obscuribacter sp.]